MAAEKNVFRIGDCQFPLEGVKNIPLRVIPAKSGGVIYAQHLRKGTAELLAIRSSKPPDALRLTLPNVFGLRRKIMITPDWVRIGDTLYERSKTSKAK